MAALLLMKKDYVSVAKPNLSAPAWKKAIKDIPHDWYVGLFLSAVMALAVTVVIVYGIACDVKVGNSPATAATEKVQSLAPAIYWLAGATAAASYLALTLHWILPRFAHRLWVLNVILLSTLIVFLVVILFILCGYTILYVFGGIAALGLVVTPIVISVNKGEELKHKGLHI